MMEDNDWNEMISAWQAGSPETPGFEEFALRQAKAHAHRAQRLSTAAALTASLAIGVVTLWCALHLTVLHYTFTVIAWSAFLSLGGYMLFGRERDAELALQTRLLLTARVKRLKKSAELLNFLRVLSGVETLVSLGLWIAFRYFAGRSFALGAETIAAGGVLVYGSVTGLLARSRQKLHTMEELAATLQEL